jgi:hypothetical protein
MWVMQAWTPDGSATSQWTRSIPGLLSSSFHEIGADYVRARCGEFLCDGRADAGCRTGDEGDLSFEAHGVISLCLVTLNERSATGDSAAGPRRQG